jgi:hypothetical protein
MIVIVTSKAKRYYNSHHETKASRNERFLKWQDGLQQPHL